MQIRDVSTGQKLQERKSDPLVSAASSDGKWVVLIRDSGVGVDIYSVDGLTLSGSWAAPMSVFHSFGKSQFSPGGSTFVLADS